MTTSEFLLPRNETTWAHFFNSFASFAPSLVFSTGAKIKILNKFFKLNFNLKFVILIF
jgi:hypothetical protein